MKRFTFFIGLCLGVWSNVNAQTTYIVDQGGGLYTTITAAVSAAANNDTIKVIAGTYAENVTVAKKLIFIGQTGTEVTSGSDAFAFNSGSGGSVVSGFIIRGRIIINNYQSSDANRITIANNTLYNNIIDVGGVVTIANNTINRIGTPGTGIVFRSPGVTGATAVVFNNKLRSANISIQAGLIDVVANSVDAYAGTGIDLPYVNSGVNYGTLRIVANRIDSCTTGMSFANCNVFTTDRIIGNNVITYCATGLTILSSGTTWFGVFHNNIILQ